MLSRLWQRYRDYVTFVDVIVRQAHPGERLGRHENYEQKRADGMRYQAEEGIPYLVLIDDLYGTTHRRYGMMADPIYLIDAAGRIAFYGMWAHVPTLQVQIERLLNSGGYLEPNPDQAGRVDNRAHLLAPIVDGFRGPMRGGWQAWWDLEKITPGSTALMAAGRALRPVLAPIALRTEPLPKMAKAGLALAGLGLAWVALSRVRRTA